MILYWLSSVADGARENFDETIFTVKRSLEFLGPQVDGVRVPLTTEEDLRQNEG